MDGDNRFGSVGKVGQTIDLVQKNLVNPMQCYGLGELAYIENAYATWPSAPRPIFSCQYAKCDANIKVVSSVQEPDWIET
jgi:hypothetical protein